MKYLIWLTLTMVGCATTSITHSKPSGEQVFSSLFEASDRDLSKEPLCNMTSVSNQKKPYQLKHHLAAILASSHENNNSTSLQTDCGDSKHQKENGELVDIWDCKLTTNELTASGELISASTVAFGLSKTDLKYVPLSLRCF